MTNSKVRPKPKRLKISTAAYLAGVGPRTIRRQIKSGKLRATPVGGLVLVHYDSFEKLYGLEDAA
jgi:excisionase family DNA binding protein